MTMPLLSKLRKRPINPYLLIMVVSLFLAVSANYAFFAQIHHVYPWGESWGFVLSLACVLLGVLLLLTVLMSYRWVFKPVLIFLVMVSAVTAYFTDTYGTVYDTNMLQNALQTDKAETQDLLNVAFFLRVLFLGVLPSVLIAYVPIFFPPLKKSLLQRLGVYVLSLAMIILPILLFSSQYASFFRVHKPLRYYVNPVTPIYSVFKLGQIEFQKATTPKDITYHASDALRVEQSRKPRLVVMVVGETARADHVQFNGYARTTFPKLAQMDNLTNFSQVMACGTSTAYSVPCMFSYLGAKDYEVDTADFQENVLDTLHRLGVPILWRDNNSTSKGVMDKLPAHQYVDYKTNQHNSMCDNPYQECRDVGMLVGLDDFVATHQGQDMLIVLHQMGNHGPAYYKRYDEEFAKFSPVCEQSELAKCDHQALINGYDNALLATDDFLAKTISWLGEYVADYEVAMLYASDHGESLGEKGIYLHGMPNAFAPIEQKHIPAFFWSAGGMPFKSVAENTPLSHDAITPTLLKLFDIDTQAVAGRQAFIQ